MIKKRDPRATAAVQNAIKRGVLVRPKACSQCSKDCKPHAHHNDYSRDKWLEVEWLCAKCHSGRHRGPRSPYKPRKDSLTPEKVQQLRQAGFTARPEVKAWLKQVFSATKP